MKISIHFLSTLLFAMVVCDLMEPKLPTEQKPYFYAYLQAEDSLITQNGYIYKPLIRCQSDVFASPKPEGGVEVRLNGARCDSVIEGDNALFSVLFGTTSTHISTRVFYLPVVKPFFGDIKCEIQSAIGSVEGNVSIPAVEVITSHKNKDSISTDKPLKITWEGNALNYWVFSEYFSNGSSFRHLFIDTIIADKEIMLPVDTIYNKTQLTKVEFTVIGINGLKIASGTRGNMTGDGIGYLYAVNISEYFNREITLYTRHVAGAEKSLADVMQNPETVHKQMENRLFAKVMERFSKYARNGEKK